MMILVLNNILTEVSNFFLPALIFVITTLKIVLLKKFKKKKKERGFPELLDTGGRVCHCHHHRVTPLKRHRIHLLLIRHKPRHARLKKTQINIHIFQS